MLQYTYTEASAPLVLSLISVVILGVTYRTLRKRETLVINLSSNIGGNLQNTEEEGDSGN